MIDGLLVSTLVKIHDELLDHPNWNDAPYFLDASLLLVRIRNLLEVGHECTNEKWFSEMLETDINQFESDTLRLEWIQDTLKRIKKREEG